MLGVEDGGRGLLHHGGERGRGRGRTKRRLRKGRLDIDP